MKYSKLYTGNGDNGYTKLGTGRSISKAEGHLHILGEIDELNCQLGYLYGQIGSTDTAIEEIQRAMIRLMGMIAMEQDIPHGSMVTECEALETRMKHLTIAMDNAGMSQNDWVLYGKRGGRWVNDLDMVGVKARRVERELHSFFGLDEAPQTVSQYLNMLSKYFYLLARYDT